MTVCRYFGALFPIVLVLLKPNNTYVEVELLCINIRIYTLYRRVGFTGQPLPGEENHPVFRLDFGLLSLGYCPFFIVAVWSFIGFFVLSLSFSSSYVECSCHSYQYHHPPCRWRCHHCCHPPPFIPTVWLLWAKYWTFGQPLVSEKWCKWKIRPCYCIKKWFSM